MEKYFVQKHPLTIPTSDGKLIQEHYGQATDGDTKISIARMVAPPGWSEPFQTPEFDEYTVVVRGRKQCIVDGETIILEAGQSIKICKNTRVQYANPFEEECEYIAICLPAFSLDHVHRENP